MNISRRIKSTKVEMLLMAKIIQAAALDDSMH